MRRIAVLGGGVAGLAAALYLRDAAAQRRTDLEITVFERSARTGGCVQTVHEAGYTMELGPDSLLADKPAARELLQRLQLDDQLVPIREEYHGSLIVHRGKLRPIPADFRLFSPTSIPALIRGGIFSATGIARAAMEPLIPPRESSEDESVASFVTRRFGREVLERLAQPLIGGIYSGDPRRLSMQATLPQFVEMERSYGSLVRAMTRARGNGSAPQLMSLRDGLQSIVDAMRSQIGPLVRVSSEVQTLSREGDAWQIGFADGSRARADAVICALPAYAAARALRSADPELADLLEGIRYNSIATVNVAYDAADLPELPRTPGFVVPAIEGRRITAATISTQKYPQRSPPDGVLLRAFIGGALALQLVESSDAELAAIAREEFAELLGIRAEPRFAVTRRWMRLLPEYGVGHLRLIVTMDARANALGGLALAGSAYRGVGIPDCAASGQAAAARLLSA